MQQLSEFYAATHMLQVFSVCFRNTKGGNGKSNSKRIASVSLFRSALFN